MQPAIWSMLAGQDKTHRILFCMSF